MRTLFNALKHFVKGTVFLGLAVLILISLLDVKAVSDWEKLYESLPNYNYLPDIESLKDQGKLTEALELARYVSQTEDMPGREEAKQLASELENEITSVWGRAKRVTKGFVLGSGNSIEELSGGIASDIIVYGDIRDLVKQGYFKITGNETDSVVAALAGIGLLTELADIADWVPSILKAFRKIGALTREFSTFLFDVCKKSAKALKLDMALEVVLKNLKQLVDNLGMERSASMFKHIRTPADLSAIVKTSNKSRDAAYFTIKNGGDTGVDIIKHFDASDDGIGYMLKGAQKGPAGITWLKKKTRITARILKNIWLERPQKLITELAKRYLAAKAIFWMATVICSLFAFFNLSAAGSDVALLFKKKEVQKDDN